MSDRSYVISNSQVKRHMTPMDVIEIVEQSWKWYGEGQIIMPSKVTTDMTPAGVPGWFNSMPSYIAPLQVAGIKLVGGYAENPKHGKPYIKANLMLTDPESGDLRAVMCGDWISDYRTGAQAAVAAKYLAARTDALTIIGAGNQAFYCLDCMRRILDIKEVRVCDISAAARERFIARFPDAPFRLVSCETNEVGCRGADMIITITTANAALVEDPWVKPGALVMTMGSFTETSADLVINADKLMLDHIGQGLHRGNLKEMAAKGLVTEASIGAVLPDVVCGKATGREHPDQRIVIELVGMGCLDLAVAATAYARILASGEKVVSVDMENG